MLQIIPSSARSLLKPQIEALIGRLNIRWIEPSVYTKYTGSVFRHLAQGTYHVDTDSISVKANRRPGGRDENYVFLHELTHWTGHESRLKRDIMVTHYVTREEMEIACDQEEATAELGAYLLCPYFGLDQVAALSVMLDYVANYPKADLVLARKDAEEAVFYVLSLLNEQTAKAA